ncbi:MAG: Bug family tripartite tricarboxylate transporter substrate binding protein [Caldimonas sp.]
MNSSRRRVLQIACAGGLLSSAARSWPQQTDVARLLVGFPAGGTADTMCRRVAERLQPAYAKAVVVENKPGAGGQLAVQALKSQPADGNSILMTPMSMLGIYPHIYKKLPYDPVADLSPVSLGATFEFGLAVGPMVPASVTDVTGFLAWCKANPDRASFGSPAAGSIPHFIGVLLGRAGNVPLTHVAYRGTGPALLDVTGGHLAAVSGLVGDLNAQTVGGKVRFLGVSGATRNRFVPAVPTYAEQGFKDLVFNEWYGFYLPADARPEAVSRLNTNLVQVLAHPDVIQGVASMGLEAVSSTPGQLAERLQADTRRWGPIVKSIGFTAES